MDAKLKSVTLLTLILLASFIAFLLPHVSEARPLLSPLQGKEGSIGEVNGVFRTLTKAGPSPGVGHRLKKLQNVEGHRLNTVQVIGVIKNSGPSPGQGHKYITNNHS